MPESPVNLASEDRWYAVAVKPRHEKSVAAALDYKGFAPFLPQYQARRNWSDRVKKLEVPLFAGYVFGRFRVDVRHHVLRTPGVISILGFGEGPVAISDSEIDAVRKLLSSGRPVGPWPYLKVGQRIRIEGGPLANVEGILLKVKDSQKLVVGIHLLQRAVAVTLDADIVSPAGGVSASSSGRQSLEAGRAAP